MKSINLLALIALTAVSCGSTMQMAQLDAVIPRPAELRTDPATGPFVLRENTVIIYTRANDDMASNAEFLQQYIEQITGIRLSMQAVDGSLPSGDGVIVLKTGLNAESADAYCLTVDEHAVTIEGASPAGVFYGIQTLRKSLPIGQADRIAIAAMQIDDSPRFAWRGMMLDCSRHFFPVEFVRKYIDLLALHNCNRFHWHLSDDQGWRIEIKKYPRLIEVGSQRKQTVIGRNTDRYDGTPYGGYYTQADAREIVAYAAERYITVVPEIDMPGHMLAAMTAYPELGCKGSDYDVWPRWGVADEVLCAGKESTFEFVENVLTEIMDIFPSQVIHIGGDECPKTAWEHCPLCQARIRAEKLRGDKAHTAEQKLQSYFTQRVARFVNARGRTVLGWDEVLEGDIPSSVMVMSWRGEAGGIQAARLGHDVVMVPNNRLYFDYYQTKDVDKEPLAIGGYIPVESVYAYDPVPEVLTDAQKRHITGVQANLWTEYILSQEQVEYMVLPRLAALSEVQWSTPENKDYAWFLKRLPHMLQLYDLLGYNYAKHLLRVEPAFGVDTTTRQVTAVLSAMDNAPIRYTLDGSEPTLRSTLYEDTLRIDRTSTLRAIAVRGGQRSEEISHDICFSHATACPVTLLSKPHESYVYDGAQTLCDGLQGNKNYRTGRWVGFYDTDVVAVIDLKRPCSLSRVAVQVCVNKDDGCFDARRFEVSTSDDGQTYLPAAAEEYRPMTEQDDHGVYAHALSFAPRQARYVKVTLACERSIPAWYVWPGIPAFIFVDEIVVE